MCASIHLSFKMEALKTASPTQGRLGPVRSNRTYTYRKKRINPELSLSSNLFCKVLIKAFRTSRMINHLLHYNKSRNTHSNGAALLPSSQLSLLGVSIQVSHLDPLRLLRSKCENANRPQCVGSGPWKGKKKKKARSVAMERLPQLCGPTGSFSRSDAAAASSDLHSRRNLRLRDGDADGRRNVLALVAGGEEDVFH